MLGQLLLATTLGLPLLMLATCLSAYVRERMLAWLVFAPLPAIAAALFAVDSQWLVLGQGRLQLALQLDFLGAILLGVAALLWGMAGLYAATYLRGTANAGRFVVCWLMTLTGCLGAFVAADMFSFYLLLALLSVGACGLVVHDQSAAAWRCGGIYLGLSLFAESCVLLAFILLAAGTQGDSLLIRDVVAELPQSPWRDLTLGLLIVGLGLKSGLVPLHVWMPLAHAAAPIPASAVLSGAVVKVGIIGLIRFLPLHTALPEWGFALTVAGLFTALYGVAIGITQQHPKAVLAYSSVSQMGVIVAVLGMGLSAGETSAALSAVWYAAHHVLVKGTLFLAVGLVAATGARHLWPLLLVVAVLALGLGGLPLTGGALAKYAVKGPLGDGLAATVANVSAAGTTLLMLHFVYRLKTFAAKDAQAQPGKGLLIPWCVLALASLLIPWLMYLWVATGTVADLLEPASLWLALRPPLVGIIAAIALWYWGGRLPRVPIGDIALLFGALLPRNGGVSLVLEQLDAWLRRWALACVALVVLSLLFAWTLYGGVRG